RLTRLAADFESEDVWQEWGFSSCSQWLSVSAGFDPFSGRELLRVGQALRALPKLREAFAAGALSLDKLRAITRVAAAADEDVWLDIALACSGAQLVRICREFHKALSDEDAERIEAQRGVDFNQRLDGLVTITARLLPEEAEIVSAAIEKIQRQEPPDEGRDWNQRDADAFVEMCRRGLAAEPEADPVARVVIHIDESENRCHGRFRLPMRAAEEVSCDAEVQYQTQRGGVPIDLGRARRVVSPQLSRALRARDGGCVFPGCGRKKVHAHHLEHWARGGRTDLDNLLSFCAFHHHQLHRGAYRVTGEPRRLGFETKDGVQIGALPQAARGQLPAATRSPKPEWYEPRLQLRHLMTVVEDGVAFAHRE
ncbi:MAG TPA: DUF222 domain-containing protein, partial [Candidatus Dormibacteraeota bacterium]